MRSLVGYLKSRLAIRRLDWGEALEKGEQLLKVGKAAESIPYFQRSLEANPGEPGTENSYKWAKERLAEALKKTGRHRRASALLREMTPSQYRWSVVRAGLLVTAFIVGGGFAVIFGSMFLLRTFAGQEVPPIPVDLSRGETATIDVRFLTPVDISARAATVEPAARYEGIVPWVVRPWKGFENRDAGVRILGGSRVRCYEVVIAGQQRGLVYGIDAPDIENGYGGARVIVAAGREVPLGSYKIWLTGAYLDHTRMTKRFHPDIIVWQAGPSTKETVPLDAGAGRIPVIEVKVK